MVTKRSSADMVTKGYRARPKHLHRPLILYRRLMSLPPSKVIISVGVHGRRQSGDWRGCAGAVLARTASGEDEEVVWARAATLLARARSIDPHYNDAKVPPRFAEEHAGVVKLAKHDLVWNVSQFIILVAMKLTPQHDLY